MQHLPKTRSFDRRPSKSILNTYWLHVPTYAQSDLILISICAIYHNLVGVNMCVTYIILHNYEYNCKHCNV